MNARRSCSCQSGKIRWKSNGVFCRAHESKISSITRKPIWSVSSNKSEAGGLCDVRIAFEPMSRNISSCRSESVVWGKSVDLGGRRIIKKKKKLSVEQRRTIERYGDSLLLARHRPSRG